MQNNPQNEERLSPWWKNGVFLVLIAGFSVLIWLAVKSYQDAPPIPDQIRNEQGDILFTGDDIRSGQEIFLRQGLMNNGTVWGHGAYLGPDFSTSYLYHQTNDAYELLAKQKYQKSWSDLNEEQKEGIRENVAKDSRVNRYDPSTGVLTLSAAEAYSYEQQQAVWRKFFSEPHQNFGLPEKYIDDAEELRLLTAFFFWTSWASVTNRPGKEFSYTNNFPYAPAVNNVPTHGTLLWSALSLIALLGGTGLALFVFGRFDFLGW
jgi:nitric oxide reductase subunit B